MGTKEISLKEWLAIRDQRRNDLANPVFTLYSSPKTLRDIADSVPLDLHPKERHERIAFLRGRYLMTLPACETVSHDIQYHGDGKVELLGRKRKGEK